MRTTVQNRAGEVLTFWQEAGPESWYRQDALFDRTIRDRFGALWDLACAGGCDHWAMGPKGAVGLIVLADQLHRGCRRRDHDHLGRFDRRQREPLLRLLLLHRYSCLPAQIACDGWARSPDFSALARRIWP